MGWGEMAKTMRAGAKFDVYRSISEDLWQATVLETAVRNGWFFFHDYDSRRNEAGFPDLILGRADDLVVAELKTETGKVTPEQGRWLSTFEAKGIDVFVWRPSDQRAVEARLARRP